VLKRPVDIVMPPVYQPTQLAIQGVRDGEVFTTTITLRGKIVYF
jgi:hypothetical protein